MLAVLAAWQLWVSAAFLFCLTTLLHVIAILLGIWPTPLGCANFILLNSLLAWFLLDLSVSRRQIYEFFGLVEDVIKPEVRFARKVALLTCVLAGVAATVIAVVKRDHSPADAPAIFIPEPAYNSIVLLTGIFIAAFGWMYTGFQAEKAYRVTQTLQTIRDQLYGDYLATIYLNMSTLISHARAENGLHKNKFCRFQFFASDCALCQSTNDRETRQIKRSNISLISF